MGTTTFYPGHMVPGATRKMDFKTGEEVNGKTPQGKVYALWDMPKPVRTAMHFANRAQRKDQAKGTVPVPIFRGVDIRVARDILSQHGRAQRRAARDRLKESWVKVAPRKIKKVLS